MDSVQNTGGNTIYLGIYFSTILVKEFEGNLWTRLQPAE
jgi:hypothetical protein